MLKLPKLNDLKGRDRANTTNLQNDKQQQSLNGSKTLLKNNFVSPFKEPTDMDIFDFCEDEKLKKQQQRQETQEKKVWEKISEQPLKHFKNFEEQVEINQSHKIAIKFQNKQKRSISMALNIIKERQIQKEHEEKKPERIQDILEQKKEMFHVTMSYGIIEKEIEKLKVISSDKEKALEQSEQLLQQDQEHFQKYMEQNEQERINAEQRAERAQNEKKVIENKIKQLQFQLTQINTDKVRNQEIVENCKNLKVFLDGMATKEWLETRSEKIKSEVEKYKNIWIEQKSKESKENDQQSSKTKISIKAGSKPKTRLDWENEYQESIQKEEIEKINQVVDNYEMYFNHADQLRDYFNMMEEKNLHLISLGQEELQKYQDLKNSLNKEKEKYGVKLKQLQDQQKILLKQRQDLEQDIKALQQRNYNNTVVIEGESDDIREKIIEIYKEFESELHQQDVKTTESKVLLAEIESYLEKLLKEISFLDKDLVKEQQKKVEMHRKKHWREIQQVKIIEEQQEKNKKNREKIMQPSKKREGRQDMLRSAPKQKIIVKLEKQEYDPTEEDKKYFKEDFNLGYKE